MQKALLLSLMLCLGLTTARSQEMVSVNLQAELSTTLLTFTVGTFVPVQYAVKAYGVTYTTTDAFGQPDTASGMMAIPVPNNPAAAPFFPLAIYHHGTVPDRTAVPSNPSTQERLLAFGLTTNGYITLAPDYFGLGSNAGLHPYVHAETEARSATDLLLAARAWLTDQEIRYNQQLFLTGYSQGGHASAATHRAIETDPALSDLTVTAASHLSGPYDISGIMGDLIFGPDRYDFLSYLAYTYISYNYVYGMYDDLGQVFQPEYVPAIDSFINEQLDLDQLNDRMNTILTAETGDEESIPAPIFQDSILDILANQPDHPINVALRDNDLYNWAPQAPTRLFYCTADEQVPFQNALKADSVMTALGAPDVEAVSGGPLSHGGCVFPAVVFSLNFFNQFAVISSNDDPEVFVGNLQLSPNPVRSGGLIRFSAPELLPSDATISLIGMDGRHICRLQGNFSDGLRMPNLAAGVYVLRIESAGRRLVERVVVR
ncbi:MAG: T9SS type A sorting domain-containing protein [Saprospiraceae bacterium]